MKKFSKRKDFVTPPDQMNTYNVNFEYIKNSLGKVPNFERYIDRPPQEKKIIYNEYYTSLDQIYGSLKTKDSNVAFSVQKPRDDLMYRQESKVGSKLSTLIGNSILGT